MKNFLKILGVILCVALIAFFALLESGVAQPFIETYKNNFKRNISGIANLAGIELPMDVQLYLDDMSTPAPKPTMTPAEEQLTMEEFMGLPENEDDIVAEEGTSPLTTKEPIKEKRSKDILPIALDMAASMKFAVYKGDVICANETSYKAFDTNGKLLWDETIQMQDPSLKVAGNYVLINEIGAKRISLYEGKKNLYTIQTESNIVSCDVSERGDVVAVTEKEYYKGQVVVFNKSGERIFAWDSGSYNILDADISPKRRVAISLLNTDEGADSYVTSITVNGDVKYKTELFKNNIIFDVEYVGESLNVFSENGVRIITASGKVAWENIYEDKILSRRMMDRNGDAVLFFDTAQSDDFVTITKKGKAYPPIRAESEPDSISISDGFVAYNSGRDIILTNKNGKKTKRATCDSDIRQIHIIDSGKVLAVYSSSIQFKKMTKSEEEAVILLPQESPVPQEEE